MHRRPLTTLALALSLTAVAAGCSTVSDSNAVARVNDVELSQDDLNAELEVSSGEVLPLEPIRAEIGRWIQSQLVPEDEIAGIYDQGPAEAGIVCVGAIFVSDQAAAEAGLADLEAGAAFTEVFAAANINESLVATNGAVPCIPAAELEANADTPVISVVSTLSAAEPFGIAPYLAGDGTEAAWVVIAFRPFAELDTAAKDEVTGRIDVSSAAVDADIYVASRYGTFDPATGEVVGLG